MRWNDNELAQGPLPLWFQIADRLRLSISSGEFKPGDILPSETEINAAFKVSRTTARASLDRLRQEGLISRKAGRGSIVLRTKVEQPINELSSFPRICAAGVSRPLTRHSAPPRRSRRSKRPGRSVCLDGDESVFCIRRLLSGQRRADGHVAVLARALGARRRPARRRPRNSTAGSLYLMVDRPMRSSDRRRQGVHRGRHCG